MKSHPRRPATALRAAMLAAAALAWLGPEAARGDVTQPGTTVLANITYPTGPQYVSIAPGFPSTGWDIRQIVFSYTSSTDTLNVDVKTTGIAGDADGSGHPGGFDPKLAAVGGYNPANLGGLDSITLAFNAAKSNGAMGGPVAIAGVPEYKVAGSGLDGFELAHFVPGPYGLQVSYGNPITTAVGTLLYSPSAQHPDFQFTIQNFSHLSGLNLANGFYFSAYAGSPVDVVAGEDHINWTQVGGYQAGPQIIPLGGNGGSPGSPPGPSGPPIIYVPEPTSVALLGLGGVGLCLAGRKRRLRAEVD